MSIEKSKWPARLLNIRIIAFIGKLAAYWVLHLVSWSSLWCLVVKRGPVRRRLPSWDGASILSNSSPAMKLAWWFRRRLSNDSKHNNRQRTTVQRFGQPNWVSLLRNVNISAILLLVYLSSLGLTRLLQRLNAKRVVKYLVIFNISPKVLLARPIIPSRWGLKVNLESINMPTSRIWSVLPITCK